MKPIDVSGQRFGRLVLLERRGVNYLCQCDCGKETIVYRGNLTGGVTKSCGCLRKETTSERMSKFNKLWASSKQPNTTPDSLRVLFTRVRDYQRNAEKRGLSFELTEADFKEIVDSPCHYCGTEDRIGLDRVDSSRGYDYANVVACCTVCNQAKNNRSVDEFYEWVNRVHSHIGRESR